MLRKASFAAILAGAVGVPYAVWNGGDVTQLADGWLSESESDEQTTEKPPVTKPTSHTAAPQFTAQPPRDFYDPTAHDPTGAATDPYGQSAYQQATLTGPTTIALAEVLRMDISHQWVTERFTRVTTTLADSGYDGLRVPLVTGTTESDLTGSLTYYFDRGKNLQRITFHGTTGNPQQLAALLAQREFQHKKCLSGELYTRGWMNRTDSVCRVRPAGVLHAGARNTRYEVLLEINQPGWKSTLSPTAKQLVE